VRGKMSERKDTEIIRAIKRGDVGYLKEAKHMLVREAKGLTTRLLRVEFLLSQVKKALKESGGNGNKGEE